MFGLCCKFERMARTIAPAFQACRMLSNAGTKSDVVMNVFDRKAKRLQRDYSASLEDYNVYEYVKEEVRHFKIAMKCHECRLKFAKLLSILLYKWNVLDLFSCFAA